MFIFNIPKNDNNNRYTNPAIAIGMVSGFAPAFIASTILYSDKIHHDCESDLLCWTKEIVIGGPLMVGLAGLLSGGTVGYAVGDIMDQRAVEQAALILSGNVPDYGSCETA